MIKPRMWSLMSSETLLTSGADRCLLQDGAPAPNASALLTHIPEIDIHRKRHQSVVESIVLPEARDAPAFPNHPCCWFRPLAAATSAATGAK
jgi:hypothetical protein